jgi:hypothetical protein
MRFTVVAAMSRDAGSTVSDVTITKLAQEPTSMIVARKGREA